MSHTDTYCVAPLDGPVDTDVVVATFCRIGPAEATEPLAAITTRPLN